MEQLQRIPAKILHYACRCMYRYDFSCLENIKSRSLRLFLLKYYDKDGDGKLSARDLESVEMLEITNARLQLWDESPEISLVTRCFCHPSDLRKLPRLKCLVISGQPVFWLNLPQSTLEEVLIVRCPLLRITPKHLKYIRHGQK